MHDAHAFLEALTIVLCTAGVTTVTCHWLKQPVVLGYIVAGLIVGPHVPVPLVADQAIVHSLSELGVILLMFSLGLEFSLSKLASVGLTAGLTAIVQCSVMLWLGSSIARVLGWTPRESIFTGAIIAISSTTIIAKAFDEQRVRGPLRELVVGVLIVEDLIAILLMAVLTAIAEGGGLSAAALARSSGRLAAFLVAFVVIGLVLVPRAIRAIQRLGRPETTLVVSIGLCFGSALLAQRFGYSVALGAFVAGSLVAESGQGGPIEHLVQPVRDMFGAIFFVSVGMLIEPTLVARHSGAIVVLTLVVIVGKVVSVALGAFLTGNGTRTAVRAGMSLAQICEFSFIIAGLGVTLNATGTFLYPVAVAVSALTTLTTPFLIRASEPTASWVDRKLPHALQNFASLYASWIERLRSAPRADTWGSGLRRLARLLLLDAALLAGLAVAVAVVAGDARAALVRGLGVGAGLARLLVSGAVLALSAPFVLGIFRIARGLAAALAAIALPAAQDAQPDSSVAPRRVLVATLQCVVILAVGLPLLVLTQPFVTEIEGAALFASLLGVLGLGFWHSASSLEGHVRAGTEVIVQALAQQARGQASAGDEHALDRVEQWLPGLGKPLPFRLRSHSAAVGKTLAELDLRGLTGASVLAIVRGEGAAVTPAASDRLQAGDLLAIAGTAAAVDAAKALLEHGALPASAAADENPAQA